MRPGCVTYATPDPAVAAPHFASDQYNLKLGAAADWCIWRSKRPAERLGWRRRIWLAVKEASWP